MPDGNGNPPLLKLGPPAAAQGPPPPDDVGLNIT
jgi:hypothetical protein